MEIECDAVATSAAPATTRIEFIRNDDDDAITVVASFDCATETCKTIPLFRAMLDDDTTSSLRIEINHVTSVAIWNIVWQYVSLSSSSSWSSKRPSIYRPVTTEIHHNFDRHFLFELEQMFRCAAPVGDDKVYKTCILRAAYYLGLDSLVRLMAMYMIEKSPLSFQISYRHIVHVASNVSFPIVASSSSSLVPFPRDGRTTLYHHLCGLSTLFTGIRMSGIDATFIMRCYDDHGWDLFGDDDIDDKPSFTSADAAHIPQIVVQAINGVTTQTHHSVHMFLTRIAHWMQRHAPSSVWDDVDMWSALFEDQFDSDADYDEDDTRFDYDVGDVQLELALSLFGRRWSRRVVDSLLACNHFEYLTDDPINVFSVGYYKVRVSTMRILMTYIPGYRDEWRSKSMDKLSTNSDQFEPGCEWLAFMMNECGGGDVAASFRRRIIDHQWLCDFLQPADANECILNRCQLLTECGFSADDLCTAIMSPSMHELQVCLFLSIRYRVDIPTSTEADSLFASVWKRLYNICDSDGDHLTTNMTHEERVAGFPHLFLNHLTSRHIKLLDECLSYVGCCDPRTNLPWLDAYDPQLMTIDGHYLDDYPNVLLARMARFEHESSSSFGIVILYEETKSHVKGGYETTGQVGPYIAQCWCV
jgi:hypothetical protein